MVERAILEYARLRSANERGWMRRAVSVVDESDQRSLTRGGHLNRGGVVVLPATYFGCYSVLELDLVGSSRCGRLVPVRFDDMGCVSGSRTT